MSGNTSDGEPLIGATGDQVSNSAGRCDKVSNSAGKCGIFVLGFVAGIASAFAFVKGHAWLQKEHPWVMQIAPAILETDACSAMTFDAKYVDPNAAKDAGLGLTVEVATKENINTSIPIDLTGIWWIRWVSEQVLVQGYNLLHLEEGLSFAGMKSNTTGPPWFPATLSAQTGLSHRWMFSDSIVGKTAMLVSAETKSPTGNLNIYMYNATHGEVDLGGGGGAYFIKIDEDRWLRKNYFCGAEKLRTCDPPSGVCPDCDYEGNYELTRIINGDGTQHSKYFPLFLQHMSWHKIRVFTEDDGCERTCGLTTSKCNKCTQKCNEA